MSDTTPPMALDPPARIAVLGAGPIGLEAALYGRFLGYDVDVYERGAGVAHVAGAAPAPCGSSADQAAATPTSISAAISQ